MEWQNKGASGAAQMQRILALRPSRAVFRIRVRRLCRPGSHCDSANGQKLFSRCAVTRVDSQPADNGVEVGSEFFNVCSRGKITVRNSLSHPPGHYLLETLAQAFGELGHRSQMWRKMGTG